MKIETYNNITPTIGENCFIHTTSSVIGDVSLGDNCSVWPQVAIRGDVNYIKIGHSTNVQDGSVLHVTHSMNAANPGFSLNIGHSVTIGHKALLHGCTIGNRVLIGMGAIVMDGANIENQVMLGAASLVTPGKILESGYLYCGQPVQQIRKLTADELEFLAYSAAHYIKLKNSYS